MANVRPLSKPSDNISDYEWNMTPTAVKIAIEHLQQLLEKQQTESRDLQQENQWLREQLDLKIEKSSQVAPPLVPEIILWAMVGLILTIGSTFVEAFSIFGGSLWSDGGTITHSLGVSFQIGAVLLVGCLGGKNAALISQIAYLTLGLLGLPIFDRGGGWEYILEPNFGYLLGFIAGAWVCGYFAFSQIATINKLMLSCCAGLLSIHAMGIVYLVVFYYFGDLATKVGSLSEVIYRYSLAPLPGQLAVLCGVSAIAYSIRKLMHS